MSQMPGFSLGNSIKDSVPIQPIYRPQGFHLPNYPGTTTENRKIPAHVGDMLSQVLGRLLNRSVSQTIEPGLNAAIQRRLQGNREF